MSDGFGELTRQLRDASEKLPEAAAWLDTLDEVARLWLLTVKFDASVELVVKALRAVSGTEVQDDLRSFAPLLVAAADAIDEQTRRLNLLIEACELWDDPGMPHVPRRVLRAIAAASGSVVSQEQPVREATIDDMARYQLYLLSKHPPVSQEQEKP